jgi:aminoglycoside phosphotransferase (APT) family kinase protein
MLLEEEARRQYKSIDLQKLATLATRVRDKAGNCTTLPTLTRIGGSNIVIFLHFDDDEETRWVARFPVRGMMTFDNELLADVVHSMVVTMQVVAERTTIPVPKVHYWCETSDNELGRPFVLMDATTGVSLYDLEQVGINMDELIKKLSNFIDQWAQYNAELATLRFDQIGSLCRDSDGVKVGKLCTAANLHYLHFLKSEDFRGPFISVADFLINSSSLKVTGRNANTGVNPFSYDDFLRDKLTETLIPYYLETDIINGPFVLSHVDFDLQNILIDKKDGFRISGVIDWDLAAVLPLQSHLRLPDILVCDQWTSTRREAKAIAPWQIEFARRYRSQYKTSLKRHLLVKNLNYPVDTLLEGGYRWSRLVNLLSENFDEDGSELDVLWKHVYGRQITWHEVVKSMQSADWGTVMAERLSLPLPEGTEDPVVERPASRPLTVDTFSSPAPKDFGWKARSANKLRWGWWHTKEFLRPGNPDRVTILMGRPERQGNNGAHVFN